MTCTRNRNTQTRPCTGRLRTVDKEGHSHGKHDKLTKGLPGLETADPCPVGGGCSTGSDIVEAHWWAPGNPVANYCESMHKRCLDRARGTLDCGEEADRVRDLDGHRLQYRGGVRPARLAPHALAAAG